jgi:hypothetical protein
MVVFILMKLIHSIITALIKSGIIIIIITVTIMVSDSVYKLCQEAESVSSILAQNPTAAPGDIVHELYGHRAENLHHSADESRTAASSPDELR